MQFPNVDFFLHKPVLAEPPLCMLHELQDGTYSLDDLQLFHEVLDFKNMIREQAKEKSNGSYE